MSTFATGTFLVLALAIIETHSQYGNFFNYEDVTIDDPLAYIWNNRDHLIQDSYAPCVVKYNGIQNREGTCMHSSECKLNRGKTTGRGSCSFWNSCCISEKTCNQRTNARVSFFVGTSYPRDNAGKECNMQVDLINENICQLRVDILELDLEEPDILPIKGGDVDRFSKKCIKDAFSTKAAPDLPPLCGKNFNTHFYIHLDRPRTINNAIIFNMDLSPDKSLIKPTWNIKITQLECPAKDKKYNMQYKKEYRNQVAEDFHRLAPEGCLQYFTDPTGFVKSFGYIDELKSSITSGQDYAICFKRRHNECKMTYIADYLRLDGGGPDPCTNYIHIPELPAPDKLCESIIPPETWTSMHPGPQYIHVHTEKDFEPQDTQTNLQGFLLNYNTIC